LAKVLSGCRMFFNGTTVTTNAMIQRRGAKSGLIITKGFEDTLVIGRVKSRWIGLDEGELLHFNRVQRPAPVVPLELTRGVNERIDCFGNVIKSVDLIEAEKLIDVLVEQGIESLAICLLWSFKNPSHETAIADLARKKYPSLYVVSDLVPAIGEYERANTTAVEAFLGPTLRTYLSDIDRSLTRAGYKGEMLVMQSIGGLAPASGLTHAAVTTLHSGPVGGIVAACKLGELIGEKKLITADMGGTTFDVGLVVDGKPQTAQMTVMERNLLMVPAVEAISVGAGGGSVAWLHVGPQSQGARPGPACYGRGGDLPTVTDADVVLGYINPETFLGGHMSLDTELAYQAVKMQVADPLGLSVEKAAEAIYDIVNAHMADLVRRVSIERGHDPRDFAMVAFGGCGPTHATGYGVESQVCRVIVPPTATVFSAFGIAQSEIRHFFAKTWVRIISGEGGLAADLLQELNDSFAELQSRAEKQFKRDNVDPANRSYHRLVDLRYLTQVHEVTVLLRIDGRVTGESLRVLIADFKEAYERLYGAGSNPIDGTVEIVTLRMDASAKTPSEFRPLRHENAGEAADRAFLRHRQVWWKELGGYRSTPTYLLEKLRAGNVIEGPAVIESYGTTIPLHVGQRASLDEWLNLVVTFPAASAATAGPTTEAQP